MSSNRNVSSQNQYFQRFLDMLKETPLMLKTLELVNSGFTDEQIYQLCLAAVREDWQALKYVPEDQRDQTMYLAAVNQERFSLQDIPENQRVYELCLAAVNQYGLALEFVPEELRDQKMCLAAVNKYVLALEFVPEELRDQKMCLAAVNKYGLALKFVPEKLRDQKMCLAAVSQNGEMLLEVPEELRDRAMCLAAINQDWRALPFVPGELRDHAMYLAAVSQINFTLFSIPENQRVYELCLAAVHNKGEELQFVPKKLLDLSMCLAALTSVNQKSKNSHLALIFVPKELLSPSMCLIAVVQNWEMLQFVPRELRDREICLAAVNQNGWALRFVPEELRDRAMCLAAVTRDSRALQFVPGELRDHAMYLAVVNQINFTLVSIPENQRVYELCLAAVHNKGEELQFVPENLRDRAMCLAAVNQNGGALQFVPEELRDRAMCLAAVNQFGGALQFVPEELLDRAVCLAALNQDGRALKFVPEELHDEAMCLASVSQNGQMLEFVPKSKLNHDKYLAICIAAVTQEGLALKYIDEDIKPLVIDAVSPQKILSDHYEALQYFPSNPAYREEIIQFLSQVKHIVITKNNDLLNDHELKDMYLVYSNSPARKGKTIHTDKDNAKRLFEDLKVHQKEKQDINLVLLGHANETATAIANINISEATDLLRNNDSINRVTLLGCNTAKSLKLDQEKGMIRNFSEAKNPQANSYCGMILMSRQPDPSEYVNLLKKIEKDRDKKILDSTYILSKTVADGKEQYQFIHIQRNTANSNENNANMNEVIATILPFDQEKLENLEMLKGKKSPFPKDPAVPTYLRGGKGAQCMSEKELEEISAIIDNADKFDKKHPNYKQIKQKHPALGNITIDNTEENKLQRSLLKQMVDAIHKDSSLTRNITVKGYTKALHVDTKERRMLVSRTHLYPTSYTSSRFYSQKENINRKKFVNEIETEMKKGTEDSTTAKSIKITISKKN